MEWAEIAAWNWAEIAKNIGIVIGTIITVVVGKNVYQGEKQKAEDEGNKQMAAAAIAVFQPTANQYQRATLEQMIGETHARTGQIKALAEEIHAIVQEEKREKDEADAEDLRRLRREEQDRMRRR